MPCDAMRLYFSGRFHKLGGVDLSTSSRRDIQIDSHLGGFHMCSQQNNCCALAHLFRQLVLTSTTCKFKSWTPHICASTCGVSEHRRLEPTKHMHNLARADWETTRTCARRPGDNMHMRTQTGRQHAHTHATWETTRTCARTRN